MILIELFDKKDDLGDVIPLSQEFHAFKVIGGRRIRFSAGLSNSLWEVEFAEVVDNDEYGRDYETQSKHDMTGAGHEFEIMAFVMACFKRFIEKYNPKRMEFSAKRDEESRVSLYRRLLKRFAKDYIVREFDVRFDRKMYTNFDLIRRDDASVTEGAMKRSDPYISGERSERTIPIQRTKPSGTATRIKNLALKAKVPQAKVERIWDDVKRELDMQHPNAHAILMSKVKRILGINVV